MNGFFSLARYLHEMYHVCFFSLFYYIYNFLCQESYFISCFRLIQASINCSCSITAHNQDASFHFAFYLCEFVDQ